MCPFVRDVKKDELGQETLPKRSFWSRLLEATADMNFLSNEGLAKKTEEAHLVCPYLNTQIFTSNKCAVRLHRIHLQ